MPAETRVPLIDRPITSIEERGRISVQTKEDTRYKISRISLKGFHLATQGSMSVRKAKDIQRNPHANTCEIIIGLYKLKRRRIHTYIMFLQYNV